MPGSWFPAVVGSVLLCALGAPSPAAAQSRRAAISVSANVRSVTEADFLGANALAPQETDDGVGAALVSDAWRIMIGRASSVGLQVETSHRDTPESWESLVTICKDGEFGPQDCEPYRAPRIQTRTDGGSAAFVVLVGKSQRTVRVTLAFMDF